MKITCPYCRAKFNDYMEKCPNCGAPNEGVVRTTSDQPRTIEELKKWYEDRKLPPYETTRFFIGIDYKDPRAFGIYYDEEKGVYVVYKNKSDGTRAVRYSGTDEIYAVNELYQRLKQEIIEQKSRNAAGMGTVKSKAAKIWNKVGIGLGVGLIIFSIIIQTFPTKNRGPLTGYYHCNNIHYYHIDDTFDQGNGHWYEYIGDDWAPVMSSDIPEEMQQNPGDFYTTRTWDSSTQTKDFETSDACRAYEKEADRWENKDSDSDYDWDSNDSWDSGGSDFDSDW